ncbi:MAG: FixH family protein [Hoeflea sp.]|uniref:FixH family protein n=1 Tax=Hoeflea sp. TaxID=1940281 RepID=UPI0032EB832A
MTLIRSIFQPKQFTGKHMLLAMVAFFGVIITVNLTMARFAVTTWSGLVVPNTYVASQQFNSQAAQSRAIEALGYDVAFEPDATGLAIVLTDTSGEPAHADSVIASLRRPVGTDDDRDLVFASDGAGRFRAEGALAEGEWIAHVTAMRGGDVIYKKGRRFRIGGDGSLRP